MNKSLKKNRTGIALMLLSSVCVCTGQMFWKIATEGKITTEGKIINLLLGFALYGTGAIIMIFAYKHGSLSVLQPMLSMNYVLTIIIGKFILSEEITMTKLIGIAVIVFGVVMIGCGDE